MKKVAIVFFILLSCKIFSQEKIYGKLQEQIRKEYPEIKLENKLIVVNVWSVNDAESREKNKQADKAYDFYYAAKLKGGLKGMVGVLICRDNVPGSGIVLKNDDIKKALNIQPGDINFSGITNIVFDSQGNVVMKNVSGDLFKELNQLITR